MEFESVSNEDCRFLTCLRRGLRISTGSVSAKSEYEVSIISLSIQHNAIAPSAQTCIMKLLE